jgi:hypothetical protein
MDQPLLGARSSDKIRDMLVKQNPITAIRQIQENKRLNDNKFQHPYSAFSVYECMHFRDITLFTLPFIFCRLCSYLHFSMILIPLGSIIVEILV